jgi:CelD/BcsL family acetyltransferase involved in cellulose biosynthesis
MTLIVKTLSTLEELDKIVPAWESLDASIDPRTPFTSPLWIRLWWKHFQRNSVMVSDRFFVHAVWSADGELVAVAPLMLTCRPRFGPFKLVMLSFFGADTSITELRGIVCKRSDQERVVQALAEFLHAKKSAWDLIRWSGLYYGGGAKRVLEELGPVNTVYSLPIYLLDLPKTWDELRLNLSSNMRKNVRKAYESIENAGHEFIIRIVERPEDVASALDRFFVLHAKRSEASDMIVHPNKFADPRNRAFLIEYVTEMAKRNQLRIFELCIGGQTIASRLTFLLDQELYFYYAGYDPAWRDYSVMTVLMAEALKWAIAQDIKVANLSTGKDLSKLRWKPRETMVEDVVQVSPSFHGQISGMIYSLGQYYRHFREKQARLTTKLANRTKST